MFINTKKSRNADYKLLKILEQFEQAGSDAIIGTCGNIRSLIDEEDKPFYEQVSAPYLLARLVASGFVPNVEGQAGYKVTWEVVLRHKQSGAIVTFYDYKGAASVGSNLMPNEVTGQFRKDFLRLVAALVNDRFPHPYDGCVVGEVA